MNWFSVPWDLDVQVAAARLNRRILANPPLRYVFEMVLFIDYENLDNVISFIK